MTEAEELELLELEEKEAQAKGAQPAAAPTQAAAPAPTPAPTPSRTDAVRRGLTQGATLGFGDEAVGGIGALLLAAQRKLLDRNGVHITPQAQAEMQARGIEVPQAKQEGLADTYRQLRDADRAGNAAADAAHHGYYLGGEIGGGVLSSFAPGLKALNVGKGASLVNAGLKTAGVGALAGLGQSGADLTKGQLQQAAGDAALSGALGFGLGAGGELLAKGAGKLGRYAMGKVAGIDETVARKAAADAAAVTQGARSEAGRAAQDAYKQLEHLRELGARQALTPEQSAVAKELEAELAAKAQEKLLPAAARKAETAQAFKDAAASEAQRAKELASQKVSGTEALAQLKARALRYGLPALGGAVAGAAGFGGHGALVGAGSGALMGAGLRPMMHSLLRMARQPAVQRPLYSALGGLSEAAVPTLEQGALRLLPRELAPALESHMAALADKETDKRAKVLALRGDTP